jgi:hypothetical protein
MFIAIFSPRLPLVGLLLTFPKSTPSAADCSRHQQAGRRAGSLTKGISSLVAIADNFTIGTSVSLLT